MTSDETENLRANFLDFQVLKSKFVKFFMSVLKWQINFSLIFVWFFIVMTHISSLNIKLIHFLLWAKGYHQSPNFETFNCYGENLSNSSYHFWKHKSVFLQILYRSWVPSNITPPYFLSSSIIYFGQRQPIKVQIY